MPTSWPTEEGPSRSTELAGVPLLHGVIQAAQPSQSGGVGLASSGPLGRVLGHSRFAMGVPSLPLSLRIECS